MKRLILTLIILALAAPGYALTGISIGVKGGMVSNYEQPGFAVPGEDTDAMNLAGLQLKFTKLPMIDLIVSGEYAWKKETYSGFGQSFELTRSDLQFSASAIYPFSLPVVTPYLGAGVATHSLGYDYVEPVGWALDTYDIEVPGNETRMGYHLMGGFDVGLPAFPLTLNAEYRLNWVSTPDEVTKYNSITAGLSFSLP
nr:outer membrane beta-barrel protein [candidate division Zixibacteria bacterium]